MPHDAEIISETLVPKTSHGGNDRALVEKYEAPATADGGYAYDPHKEADRKLAADMMKWLEREYPGHLWGCVADLAQGIVKFNIPVLMGFQHWWTINLHTHDIIEAMRAGAGQILERYGLRRGRFELDPFLEARQKHSALVLPSRKVPE